MLSTILGSYIQSEGGTRSDGRRVMTGGAQWQHGLDDKAEELGLAAGKEEAGLFGYILA